MHVRTLYLDGVNKYCAQCVCSVHCVLVESTIIVNVVFTVHALYFSLIYLVNRHCELVYMHFTLSLDLTRRCEVLYTVSLGSR